MRTNATFKYMTLASDPYRDEDGHLQPGIPGSWEDGIECNVEVHIPAKQIQGVDGQLLSYNYSVFIPKHFDGDITIGQDVEITYDESGKTEVISIMGVDFLNRKYIELWA